MPFASRLVLTVLLVTLSVHIADRSHDGRNCCLISWAHCVHCIGSILLRVRLLATEANFSLGVLSVILCSLYAHIISQKLLQADVTCFCSYNRSIGFMVDRCITHLTRPDVIPASATGCQSTNTPLVDVESRPVHTGLLLRLTRTTLII